jgi:hypothetical protein
MVARELIMVTSRRIRHRKFLLDDPAVIAIAPRVGSPTMNRVSGTSALHFGEAAGT